MPTTGKLYGDQPSVPGVVTQEQDGRKVEVDAPWGKRVGRRPLVGVEVTIRDAGMCFTTPPWPRRGAD